MKFLVILLYIGFSSSEKLDQGYSYLPPRGAKLAGGSSGDLQTPLEYHNENQTFESGVRGYQNFEEGKRINAIRNRINNDSLFKSGSKNDEAIASIATENSNSYTQTTVYPRNRFNTVATEVPEIDAGIQSHITDKRYPMKGISILQGTESFGYHYGKPDNMPQISKEVMNNYILNSFGMYGGKPMIIKSYPVPKVNLKNMFVEPNGISNYPSSGMKIPDEIRRGSIHDTSVSTLNPNFNQNKTYKSTINSMKTVKSLNPIKINKLNKDFQKRPQTETDRTAAVLNYKNVITPEQYTYSFDTSNGIHMDETATVDGVKASGSYSYTGDDGKVYSVIYTADENGFQPKGDHLPTPPPIPEAILKVIEQARIDKEAGISHDGSYDEEKYGHKKYQGSFERYLQNIQANHKPRNRDKGFMKNDRKPMLTVLQKADKYRINGKNVLERNRNVFKKPVNNLNGQFGMRIDIPVNNQKPTNGVTLQKSINYRRPLNQNPQNSYKQEVPESSVEKYKPIETHNHYQEVNSDKTIQEYKDLGYYYVPPRQIFVEGRLQDTPSNKKTLNQLGTLYEDLNAQSISKSELYYVDQRNNNESPIYPLTNTTSNFASTGPELNTQTYASNFYDSTTSDQNELYSSEENASTSTNGVITTPKPDKNTVNTDVYDQENIKDYQEATIFPEQRDNNEDNFEQRDKLVLINLSTTPMPSEITYPNVLSDSNQYEAYNPSKGVDTTEYASKYPEDEGYFLTKPGVQITLDSPSSTNSPIYTVNEITTETTPNIKVDGFGRPIQDSQQFYSKSTNFGYTETPFIGRADDKPKTTAAFQNFEEPLDKVASPEDDVIINFNLSNSEQAITKNMDIDDTDKIIGEDFSGPKETQRYDPTSGYFY